MEFFESLDWSPLIISLKTGVVATIVSFFLGLFAARKVIRLPYTAKAVVDGILTLPMVLPPTVAGFILLLIFSRRRPVGIFLDQQLDIQVVHTWLGCILAATVIAFPLMYRNARAAFEQIDSNLVYAGRTLGMSEMNIFWRMTRYRVRNDPDLRQSHGRVWRHVHAGRQHPGEDRHDLPADRHGHTGRRLCDGRILGYCRTAHCFCDHLFGKLDYRKQNEECEALVVHECS